jgi:hypothetical protein
MKSKTASALSMIIGIVGNTILFFVETGAPAQALACITLLYSGPFPLLLLDTYILFRGTVNYSNWPWATILFIYTAIILSTCFLSVTGSSLAPAYVFFFFTFVGYIFSVAVLVLFLIVKRRPII